MNLKESLSDFVIFHGPPFVGKSSYFASELSETFKRISPRELFQTSSTLTLRQLINNYIIKPLLNGERVAVDDSMQTMAVRRSYASTVLNKVPNIQCSCLAFRPEFGKTQLLWKREIRLAEALLNGESKSLETILSSDIDFWYEKREPVLDVEDLKKFEITLPLQVYSRHAFQIPCLMIECRGVLDAKVVGLMENWFRQNRHGRIIAIYESDTNTRNEEVQKSVLEFLKTVQLTSDLVVYAYLVDMGSRGDLTSFTTSVLAFLMRLHCLDLFSLNSVYVYESLKHRKMVESVGMRHIKLARALSNADLLRHGTTQFPVPKMLQSMRVVLPAGDAEEKNADAPRVPLLQEAIESDNCIAEASVGNRRTIYIAAKNLDTLRRYQHWLLEDPNPPTYVVDRSPSEPKSTVVGQKRRLPSSSFKVLPSWMIRKKGKSSEQMSRSVDRRDRPEKGRGRCALVPSTVYIMSEKELLKTALMISREGGSTDQKDCLDASKHRLPEGRKKLVKKEKSELKEESILDEVLEEKVSRLQQKSGGRDMRDKVCRDFCDESDATEERVANVRSRQQMKPSSPSKTSPRTPVWKSPRFHSPERLAKSSCTNAAKSALISSDDANANDVCQMFVDGVPHSKSRVSSRTTVSTHQPHKKLVKSVRRKESSEVICDSNRQVVNSSNSAENRTDVDEMNFLDEVLNGDVSKVRRNLTNRDVSATDERSPVDKKVLQKSDSDISHFIDGLIG